MPSQHGARPQWTALAALSRAPALSSQAVLLTTPEAAIIGRRRERHLGLPDDTHMVASERLETLLTSFASFAGKMLLLKHPRLAALRARLLARRLLVAGALSGLPPLRQLAMPILRLFRPLQVLVTPLWAMATPVLACVCEEAARRCLDDFIRARTPAATVNRIGDDVRHVVEVVHGRIEARREELVQSVDRFMNVLKAEISHVPAETVDNPATGEEDGASSTG